MVLRFSMSDCFNMDNSSTVWYFLMFVIFFLLWCIGSHYVVNAILGLDIPLLIFGC